MAEIALNVNQFGTPAVVKLDFSAIQDALNSLDVQIQQRAFVEIERKKQIAELEAEKYRIDALKEAVKTLLGIEVTNVATTGDKMEFTVNVKKAEVKMTLDSSKALETITFTDKSYSWVNTKEVVKEARQLAAPNDLRCAITRITDMLQ